MSTSLKGLPQIDEEQLQDVASRFLEEGQTFKELHGLADEELEAVYAVAHNFVTNGKFRQAESLFRFLCFYDHLNRNYWMGLGVCRKGMGNFEAAVHAFGLAGILDLHDPRAALQSAECHLRLGHTDEAVSALNAALASGAEHEKFQPIREKAALMLSAVQSGESNLETSSGPKT